MRIDPRRWALNVLLALDQLLSAVTFGDYEETVSSRLGKLKRAHGGTIPWRRPVSKSLDWVLDKIDPNHSIDAIEENEGDLSAVLPDED